MPVNILELQRRMTSVRSTQKITKVMKLISSSYLRRASVVMRQSNEALEAAGSLMADVLDNIKHEHGEMIHPLLSSKISNQDAGISILVTANRGLCGYYNHAVMKLFHATMNKASNHERTNHVICVGNRGFSAVQKDYDVLGRFNMISRGKLAAMEEIIKLRELIVSMYVDRKIDSVDVYYTKFHSPLSMEPTHMKLLPIRVREITDDYGTGSAIFDTPQEQVLDKALLHYVDSVLYNIFAHACMSEESSRVTAMEGAERNTHTVIDDLKKSINRGRQATITNTLIDIINSAESL